MDEIRATDLPNFKAWSNEFVPPMDLSGFLQFEISLPAAMTMTELLFPQLIEVQGCVVRADRYDESNFNDWWNALEGAREDVELVVNFFPTRSYFPPSDDVEERALQVLADRIALGWRTQAAITFPDRTVVTSVVDGSEDEGPTVIMYTRRGRAGVPDEVPTPRVQEFSRSVHPDTGKAYIDLGPVRPVTPDELAGLV